MASDLEDIYDRLYAYCEAEGFAGHDPFDGLNSVLFQLTPVKYLRVARLAWLQIIKRSPIDLRRVLRVEKGVNPKTLALFALAELSRYRATKDPAHADNAKELLSGLLELGIAGDGTLAFGYNFDWQSRFFYAPRGTPAIVPTAFAARALLEAFHTFGDKEYLLHARKIGEFVLIGLNRSVETDDEVCFSYTPLDRSVIINANLLAGETLAGIGAVTGEQRYLEPAARTARFALQMQRTDGSWVYGADEKQGWVDNFHTAYVLLSLFRISGSIESLRPATFDALQRGTAYWLENFFLADGTPKYYDTETYPVDIHSAAAAIVAASELAPIDERMLPMAKRTSSWVIDNTLSPDGHFYYQVRKDGIVKTPFMRWGQAWMAYAIARLIELETT
jgi:uncharacterized protein YyaL (SSP411 family)